MYNMHFRLYKPHKPPQIRQRCIYTKNSDVDPDTQNLMDPDPGQYNCQTVFSTSLRVKKKVVF